ncbi:MAG TPA: oxidoreductase-like domain-containing protein [Burkholderiales bacterium]|nr:oxidoreductase-like domain-containing protein [Burkholderiales bacterium]
MSEGPNEPVDPQPEPPREPQPDECCQSGCDPCVYDLYWEALDRYERALDAWKRRQRG